VILKVYGSSQDAAVALLCCVCRRRLVEAQVHPSAESAAQHKGDGGHGAVCQHAQHAGRQHVKSCQVLQGEPCWSEMCKDCMQGTACVHC
jgi:hypothetical protein